MRPLPGQIKLDLGLNFTRQSPFNQLSIKLASVLVEKLKRNRPLESHESDRDGGPGITP